MIDGKEKMNKGGFTLVELLVVISIIAMLLAILMPSLQRARGQAKKVVCAHKMKQLGLGVWMYALDCGQIPWFYNGSYAEHISSEYPEKTWFNVVAKYMGGKGSFESGASAASGNLDTNPEFRKCPTKDTWICPHYAQDDKADGMPYAPFRYPEYIGKKFRAIKMERIKKPGTWILLADGQGIVFYSPTKWYIQYDKDGDGVIDSSSRLFPLLFNGLQPKAHNGGMNLALCDGHVEWIQPKEIFEVNSFFKVVHDYWWD